MSFYVGQKVVCVREHSEGILAVGSVYKVTRLGRNCCDPSICVGISSGLGYGFHGRCECGTWSTVDHDEWEIAADLFRPLLDASLEEQVNELEDGVAASDRLRDSLFSKEKVINR